jgi:hypothetical protein
MIEITWEVSGMKSTPATQVDCNGCQVQGMLLNIIGDQNFSAAL